MPSPNPPDRALQAALERLDQALEATPNDPRLLVLRGRAEERAGRYGDAAQYFRRAARAARKLEDRGAQGEALLDAALALAKAGARTDAQVAFQRSISCYELHGGTEAALDARIAFGRYRLEEGQEAEARQQLVRVLEPLERLEDADRLAWVHDRLAHTWRATDLTRALDHARQAVEWTARAHDSSAFGRRLAMVGQLHHETGNVRKARGYLQKSVPHLQRADEPPTLARVQRLLATLAEQADEPRKALEHLELAARASSAARDKSGEGQCLAERGRLLLAAGEAEPAVHDLERAARILQKAGDTEALAGTWWNLAVGMQRLGRSSGALAALERCELLHRMAGDDPEADRVMEVRVQATREGWSP